MGLGGSSKVVLHCFLIRRIVCLDCWNEISMVSVLMFKVTHWISFAVNHDLRLLDSHNFTKFYVVLSFNDRENIELMPKLVMILTYE